MIIKLYAIEWVELSSKGEGWWQKGSIRDDSSKWFVPFSSSEVSKGFKEEVVGGGVENWNRKLSSSSCKACICWSLFSISSCNLSLHWKTSSWSPTPIPTSRSKFIFLTPRKKGSSLGGPLMREDHSWGSEDHFLTVFALYSAGTVKIHRKLILTPSRLVLLPH